MLGSCRSARELLIIILTMSTRPLLCVWPFRIWRCCCLLVSVMIWSAMKYSCHQNTHQTSGFDSPRTVLLCCDSYFVFLAVLGVLISSVINTTSILLDGLVCTDLPVGPLVLGHAGVCDLILGGVLRLQGRELIL